MNISSFGVHIFERLKLERPKICQKMPKIIHKSTNQPIDMQDVIYKYMCNCSDSYIGETDAVLEHGINYHFAQKSSSIHEHITNNDTFLLNAIQHPIFHEQRFKEPYTLTSHGNN